MEGGRDDERTEEGSRYFITVKNHSDNCHYMYCLLATYFSNVRSVRNQVNN